MAKILIFDTESNGLDTERGFVQELAYALFDSETRRCLQSASFLLHWNMAYTVDPDAFNVTGLSRDYCERNGIRAGDAFEKFCDIIMQHKVEFLCGHNVLQFDHILLKNNMRRTFFDNPEILDSVPIIDTYTDIAYPAQFKNHSLKYLALDHGYVLMGAHQAMNDVFACAHILFSYPLEDVLRHANEPLVLLSAYTSYSDLQTRSQLVALKFRWNREMKCWEKKARKTSIPLIRQTYAGPLFVNGTLYEEGVKGDQMELPF